MAIYATTDDMVAHIRDHKLNRPSNDDILTDPTDYYDALTRAHQILRRKTVRHNFDLLAESQVVASSDGGDTYPLGDDHFGEIQVWTPPGPPSGYRILPAFPEQSTGINFWIEGQDLKLTETKDYTPGLTIVWVPASGVDLDANQDPTLPEYMFDALMAKAAEILAKKPGILLDHRIFHQEFVEEWSGDRNDPSDMGIVGILHRQADYQGSRTAPPGPQPWWRGISGN